MVATHRGVVVAFSGAIAASQPLAVSAGLRILQGGGTFADAAIAISAALVVTEPYASHLGGDAFVVVYDAPSGDTIAFNGSGAAPRAATPGHFAGGIPVQGLCAASVPGLVGVWETLHERYGSFSLETLLSAAINYASDGFPAGYRYCESFRDYLATHQDEAARVLLQTLTGADTLPVPGQKIVQPALGETLSMLADGPHVFYEGGIADRIVAFSDRGGGLFARDDFAAHETWSGEPIRTDYRGYTVHGQPPVSQGHILLQELNLAEGFDLGAMGWGSADSVHTTVEAKKLAFADRAAYLGDPAFVRVPMEQLLSKSYAATRRGSIDPRRAMQHAAAGDVDHDTTYFCVADEQGNAISFIQSVFHGFGCGVVSPETGILFNNRMTGFSLDPNSPNVLAPGRRTAHTLNAYLVTQGNKLAWVGGTPGGDVQVQSNLQVLNNVIDYGMNPQQAIEAPRWQHLPDSVPGGVLQVESRFDTAAIAELERRGHRVKTIGPWDHGSRYQLIAVDPESGAYHVGSDPRCDGHATGY